MTLSETSSGHTKATANYPGNPTIAPAEADGNVLTRTEVDFTVTAATHYTFTGGGTSTQPPSVFYSLTRTDVCCSIVFDQNSGGVNPSLNGTLQPGTYEYQASGQATNRKPDQAGTGTVTDSFSYGFTFKVR
jgi:hypothetical protein